MAKAIISVTGCDINPANGKAIIIYDFSSDFINPAANVPLVLSGMNMEVVLGSSVTQINAAIRTGVLAMLTAQGFPNTTLTTTDITIFGGAQ